MSYQCLICHEPLILANRSWRCSKQHVFDVAKEGYVNLMPVQHKRSKDPGDNQLMMQARRAFLESGHYQPLSAEINALLPIHMNENANVLLDIGCGEGYYTARLADMLQKLKPDFQIYGLDIAKGAIRSAAKRYKQINFCVASSYRLPFTDNSVDAVLRIYAPCDEQELIRVVADNGLLVTVTPAPEHLKQLKALIYRDIKLHSDKTELLKGFSLVEQRRLSYEMALDSRQSLNLLQMTPFAWRADQSVTQYLQNVEQFVCAADFFISVYKKDR